MKKRPDLFKALQISTLLTTAYIIIGLLSQFGTAQHPQIFQPIFAVLFYPIYGIFLFFESIRPIKIYSELGLFHDGIAICILFFTLFFLMIWFLSYLSIKKHSKSK